MVFIVTGCLYVMIFGLAIAFKQIVQGQDVLPFRIYAEKDPETPLISQVLSALDEALPAELQDTARSSGLSEHFPVNLLYSEDGDDVNVKNGSFSVGAEPQTELIFGILVTRTLLLIMLYYAALIAIGACLALGGLVIWHAKLISAGETSIEYHINKAERKRIGEKFINPYDLGRRRNWELFLGLNQPGKSFWRHILLPSSHRPTGNGYDWSHITVHTLDSCGSTKLL